MNTTLFQKSSFFLLALLSLLVGGCGDVQNQTARVGGAAKEQPPSPISASSIKILEWQPRSTVAGTLFNAQPDGGAALWFEQRGIPRSDAVKLYWDDTHLPNLIIDPDKVGTISIPKNLLEKTGDHKIYLLVPPGNERVEIGTFQVKQQ